jgi:L-methionine (R)-S-oxide reductase
VNESFLLQISIRAILLELRNTCEANLIGTTARKNQGGSATRREKYRVKNLPLGPETLLFEFRKFALTAPTGASLMEHIAERLHENMTRYNWVGFYLVDPDDSGVLIIGPFAGSFTPNARIPLNTGLCGAAASTGKTVVVKDVSKDSRYLAGSSMVKSEIVVPVFAKNNSLLNWILKAILLVRFQAGSRIL